MEYAIVLFCVCLAGMGIFRKAAEIFDRSDNFWDRLVGFTGLMMILCIMVGIGFITMYFIS